MSARSSRLFRIATLTLAAFALCVAPGFAKKPDFSPFAGTYKGTYSLSLGSTQISGSVEIEATVLRNGKKLKLSTTGFGAVPGTGEVALVGTTSLGANRRVVTDNVLWSVFLRLPATGRLFGSRNRFTYSLFFPGSGGGGVGAGTVNYTLAFTSKKLLVTGTGVLGTQTASILVSARKRTSGAE